MIVFERKLPPLSSETLKKFESLFSHSSPFFPTLATYYRDAEYDCLKAMNVQLDGLIHAEQSYEYKKSITLSPTMEVKSWVNEVKERKGIRFIKIQTELKLDDEVCVVGLATFVDRSKT